MAKKVEVVLPPGRLWPNAPSGAAIEIEVLGATGEYQSGKTLLVLSIAPGSHPTGHAFTGQPRTRYYDFEKSAGTYAGLGCDRIDVPNAIMGADIPYVPMEVFKWVFNDIRKIPAGRFDVIALDPANDVESGMVEYVKLNCEKFGLSKGQVEKAGGLLWGAVKDFWKQQLLILATRCKTFAFTTHLRDVWAGTSPVAGKREPKGKETLMELASLYLWLERKPDEKGIVSDVPSAIVLKQRLADTWIEHGQVRIQPLLPPRLPVATVGEIRRYIARPPDYAKLREAERTPPEQLTADDRLRLEVQKAEAERDTEQAKSARVSRMAELQALAAAAPQAPPPPDKTADRQAVKAEAKQTALKDAEQEEIDRKVAEATAKAEALRQEGERIAAGAGSDGPGVPPASIQPTIPTPSSEGPATHSDGSGGLASVDQCQRIVDLCQLLHIGADKLKQVCTKLQVGSVPDMKTKIAEVLIKRLEAMLPRLYSDIPF